MDTVWHILGVLLIAAVAFEAGFHGRGMWDAHRARKAEKARNMAELDRLLEEARARARERREAAVERIIRNAGFNPDIMDDEQKHTLASILEDQGYTSEEDVVH